MAKLKGSKVGQQIQNPDESGPYSSTRTIKKSAHPVAIAPGSVFVLAQTKGLRDGLTPWAVQLPPLPGLLTELLTAH